jgi:hypothetical protein
MKIRLSKTLAASIVIITLFASVALAGWAPCTTPSGGKYTVRIAFVGISMIVHSVDPMKASGPDALTVLIPNVKNGRTSFGTTPHTIPSHVPYIMSTVDMLDKNLNQDVDLYAAHNHPTEYHYYILEGQQISIDDSATPIRLNPPLCFSWDNVTECPTSKENGKSLQWIPSMRALEQDANEQKRDLKHFADIPKRDTISGRIDLLKGTLESCIVAKKKWTFILPDGTKKRQVLPQEVIWTLAGVGDQFTLSLKSFDNETIHNLVFTPVNGEIDIVIGNNPAEETGPIDSPMDSLVDPHFPLYYEFIQGNTTGVGSVPTEDPSDHKCVIDDSFLCNHSLLFQAAAPNTPNAPISSTERGRKAQKTSGHGYHANETDQMSHASNAGMGQPVPSSLNCDSGQWP